MHLDVVLPWAAGMILATLAEGTAGGVNPTTAVSPTTPSDSVIQDLRNDVLDANVAVAERKPLPLLTATGASWSKWILSLSGQALSTLGTALFWTFFSRRDRLREHLDEQDRDAYDRLRLQYVALAREKNPGDPLVEAIVTGANGQLRDLLKTGIWRDASTIPTLLDVALMMPNEAALYLLVRELDATRGHSPQLVNSLGEVDYVGVLGALVSPHIRPDAFVRLYGAHPPAKRENILADLLDSMIQSSSEVFLTWLAAAYDLASRSRSSIRSLIQSYEEDLANGNRPPLNVALALVFLYLENQQYTNVDSAKRIINERLSDIRGNPILLLRGLNVAFEESHALVRWITGSRMWQARLENVVRLVLDYDPHLEVTIREQLIGILDVLRTLQLLDIGHTSLTPQIEQAMRRVREMKLTALPFPVFAFVLRSRLHSNEEVRWQGSRFFGLFSSWTRPQQALLKVLNLLKTVNLPGTSYEPVCGGTSGGGVKEVTHLAIGDLLDEQVWERLSWSEGQVLVRTTLSAISGLPSSVWTTKRPLAHWPPVPQLNRRLRAYCGEGHLQPRIVFEEKPLRTAGEKEILWLTKESHGRPSTPKAGANKEAYVDADADVGEVDLVANTTDIQLKPKIQEMIGQSQKLLEQRRAQQRKEAPSHQRGKEGGGRKIGAGKKIAVSTKKKVQGTRTKASATSKTKSAAREAKGATTTGRRSPVKGKGTTVVRRKVEGSTTGKATVKGKSNSLAAAKGSPSGRPSAAQMGTKRSTTTTKKVVQKRKKAGAAARSK